MTGMNSYKAHIDSDDSGPIEGRCSDCGKVIYATSPAKSCHDAGNWMQCANPHYYSFIDHPKET